MYHKVLTVIVSVLCTRIHVVKAFAHRAMGRQIDPSWGGPIEHFSFQPVLHDWCNKGRGMYYPVYEMMHIKRTLAANRKEEYVAAAGFLSRYLSGPLPYVPCHITVNKVLSVSLNKKNLKPKPNFITVHH